MQLVNEIKDDIKSAKKIRLPWWGVLCWMIACALVIWLLDHAGHFDLALPALNSIAVLGLVIALKRKLSRHVWFWITMIIISALHVPLILFVPWTAKWIPAIVIAAIDSVDFVVIIAILSFVEKCMEHSRSD